MRPDVLMLHNHISEAGFQIGIDEGRWGIVGYNPEYSTWPFLIFWVKAAPKNEANNEYYFRFDLSGYPASAPTACPWDVKENKALDPGKWPKGKSLVSNTFKPTWNPSALYCPCDRLAQSGHSHWQIEHPELWWTSSFKISIYLNFIYRLLNSSDYENN